MRMLLILTAASNYIHVWIIYLFNQDYTSYIFFAQQFYDTKYELGLDFSFNNKSFIITFI